jgi:hypothetical protein
MRPVGNVSGGRFAGAASVRLTPQRVLERGVVSEEDLLAAVLDLARLRRWRSFHARPAVTGKGVRTAVQGDGVGFPDLLLVRSPRQIVAELKRQDAPAELPLSQRLWMSAFHGIAERHVWRPSDLPEIARILQ